jgi:pyruvate formate lyase activating enzyme
MPEDKFFDFLGARRGKIDAVVVSGGEPTLHDDLPSFLEKIKNLGFSTKLDTNGTRPEILANLYEKCLLDYVAMDVKHRLDSYDLITSTRVNVEKIRRSMDIIMAGTVPYEFRTTVVPAFHSADDIKSVALQLAGAKKFVLQEFLPDNAISKKLTNNDSIFLPGNEKILDGVISFCKSHVERVAVRKTN